MATAAILGCFPRIVHPKKKKKKKKKKTVVFPNLYEFPSAVERKRTKEQKNTLGTILVTEQLLHDFHSMKKKKKIHYWSQWGPETFWLRTFFKISSSMLR